MATFSGDERPEGRSEAVIEAIIESGQANDSVMIHKLQFDDHGVSTAKLNKVIPREDTSKGQVI